MHLNVLLGDKLLDWEVLLFRRWRSSCLRPLLCHLDDLRSAHSLIVGNAFENVSGQLASTIILRRC